MSDPDHAETMFTASSAAKACGVCRSTVHRYLDQGRLPGAEQDAEGVWQIPLSALLSAGWTPGRSTPSPVGVREHDRDGARDSNRHVAAVVHELSTEIGRARAGARVHAARAGAIGVRVSLYRRMIEAPPPKAPESPPTPATPDPEPTPAPDPIGPSQAKG